jgi:hypothetical protein
MQAATRHALRTAVRAREPCRRTLAIAATVKTAPDTSGMAFPAPSHASLVGDAVDIARQIADFYKSPTSTLDLGADTRAAILEELGKRASAIPDTAITAEWVKQNLKVPEKIVLGENPVFQGINK